MPNHTRTGRLLLIMIATGIAACASDMTVHRISTTEGGSAASPRSITVRLAFGGIMGTKAASAKRIGDLHHLTIKLYSYTAPSGPMGGTALATYQTTSATVDTVTLSNVPGGTYKVTAEAFSSTDDSVLISKTPPAASANYATVSSGVTPTTYTAPDSNRLVVTVNLADGTGEQVNMEVSPTDGALVGNMAPDDFGDASVHHDYTLTAGGTSHHFVWIPRFEAIQLINPPACGALMRFGVADNARPVGWWVDPALGLPAGVQGTDWVKEVFGGFYAGKYEASHLDATSATPGTSADIQVQPGLHPWISASTADAVKACRRLHPHASLLTDEQWTAMAVWAMTHGLAIYGSDDPALLRSSDDPLVTFTMATGPVAQTGSGTKAGWGAGVNLTTHTGTTGGVYDLAGNLCEWIVSTRCSNAAPYYWILHDVTTAFGVTTPTGAYVSSLETAARLRRHGLTVTTGIPGIGFGNDTRVFAASGTHARGGAFNDGAGSGIWHDELKAGSAIENGFRPALQF
jgi:hypothetical protein